MRKLSVILGSCAMMAVIIFSPQKVSAAANNAQALNPNQEYYFDLDGNGVSEKIYYDFSNATVEKTTGTDSYNVTKTYMDIYINDSVARQVEISGVLNSHFLQQLIVTDVNASDNQKELFAVSANYDKDNWTNFCWNITYLQYTNNSLEQRQNINDLISQKYADTNIHMITADEVFESDGSGKLKLELCQFIGNCDGNFVHYYTTVNLVNGTFVNTTQKSFDIVKYERTKSGKKFKCTTSTTVDKKAVLYKKPKKSSKKVRLKKGDKVTYKKVYVTDNGKVFLYVKTRSGKKGYIWPYKFTKNVYDVMHV